MTLCVTCIISLIAIQLGFFYDKYPTNNTRKLIQYIPTGAPLGSPSLGHLVYDRGISQLLTS